MTTLSTLSTFNPPPVNKPTLQLNSVQDVWKKYFAEDYIGVLNDVSRALAAHQAADYMHLCGLALVSQNRITDAIPILKSALLLYGQAPNWFTNSSIALLNAGEFETSLEFALAGLSRHNDANLHFSAGNALMQMDRLEEALQSFARAIELDPKFIGARLNLANTLKRLNRQEDAIGFYNQILNQEPNNVLAMLNRASALMELNEHDEAAMLLMRIMANSEMPEVTFMMALLRLSEGDFENGFDLYRSRFDCAMAALDKKEFKKPLISSLEQAKNNHILVSHEQGFGDSIQFIRYLPLMVENAQQVTLLIPKELHRLFASFNVKIITSRSEIFHYDFECPMLHLPYLFKTTLDSIPGNIPYLHVDKNLPAPKIPNNIKKSYKKIGLVWAGQMRKNTDLAAIDRRRSLTYKDFETFLDVKNTYFVSLQLGDPAKQIPHSNTGKTKIHEFLDETMDFHDTAALIMQLDLVITVDTAVAHLAGSLGKPVWMLSRFDQCWRWLKDRNDSPWYPGVLRIFHQKTKGDWSNVINNIKSELEKFSGSI